MTLAADSNGRSTQRAWRTRVAASKALRPAGRVPVWPATITVLLVGLVIWASFVLPNPDWPAYRVIYENGGSWLSDQGRDPLFLLLIDFSRALLGPDSYDDFRVITGLYLGIFSALLTFGRVLRPRAREVSSWTLITVVLSFTLSRFTIQIREGLAATLIIWALAAMIESPMRGKGRAGIWVLLIAAASIHIGTAVYLAIAVVAALLPSLRSRKQASQGAWLLIWMLALTIAVAIPLASSRSGDTEVLARAYGERAGEVTTLNLERVLLQVGYLLAAWFVGRETSRVAERLTTGSQYQAFQRLLGGPLLFCLTVMTFISVLISAPNVLIASYARFFYLCIGLCMVLATFAGGRRTPLTLVALFLIADQVRIAFVSVSPMLDAAGL